MSAFGDKADIGRALWNPIKPTFTVADSAGTAPDGNVSPSKPIPSQTLQALKSVSVTQSPSPRRASFGRAFRLGFLGPREARIAGRHVICGHYGAPGGMGV